MNSCNDYDGQRCDDGVTDDFDEQCCSDGDEADNLSDWQYLTETYDNDQMFATDVASTPLLTRFPIDLPNKSQEATLKRSRSNSALYEEFHSVQSRRHAMMTNQNAFCTSQLDRGSQLDHLDSRNGDTSTAVLHIESGQIQPTELLIKSWSHPLLQSHAAYQPTCLTDWLQENPTSNFTHQGFLHFPSESLSVSERPESFPFSAMQLDVNYANHSYSHQEPSGTTLLPHAHLNHTNESSFIPMVSHSIAGDGARTTRPLDFANYEIPYTDEKIKSFDAASEQPSSPKRATISKTGAIVEATFMEQEIRVWMNMIGTPSFLPPFQQFGDKKLLLHPLTPYNYYYRDERENIVSQITGENDTLPPPVSDFTTTKIQSLLYQHWFVDPVKKKRKHRKSHGKMNFEKLSKVIAQRWHQLTLQEREFYRSISRYDNAYYHEQLAIIKKLSDK